MLRPSNNPTQGRPSVTTGASVASAGTSRHRWIGLAVISVGVAMIIVDATIVNVALSSIISDLGITSSDAQWVQEVYMLVFASLLLTLGRAADVVGRRRIFLISVVIFAAASVLAALAGSGSWLNGARVLQGIGGAMILPTSLLLLNAEFRGRERGIAFAIWGSTVGGTAALGPLLGGWLTTSFSRSWAFGINVPLGLVVLVGTMLWVRESGERERSSGADLIGLLFALPLYWPKFRSRRAAKDGAPRAPAGRSALPSTSPSSALCCSPASAGCWAIGWPGRRRCLPISVPS